MMTYTQLVDSHCHLDFPELHDRLSEVLTNASQSQVGMMQTICTRMEDADNIISIANNHTHIYASVGVHPNNVHESPLVTEKTLLDYCNQPKVIGIGESGLDYYYCKEHKALQLQSFRTHIHCSQQTQLPVIIHTRDADDDTLSLLQEELKNKSFPALIHCFTSSSSFADAVLDLGLYISFSGIVTFKNAQDLQAIAKNIPLDRILVETDAPYLAPVPHRGKTNEPAYTSYTARFISELKDIPYEEVIDQTTKNFFSLFTKANSAILMQHKN